MHMKFDKWHKMQLPAKLNYVCCPSLGAKRKRAKIAAAEEEEEKTTTIKIRTMGRRVSEAFEANKQQNI